MKLPRLSGNDQDLEAVRKALVVGGFAFVGFDVSGSGEVEVAPGLLYCNGFAISRAAYKRLFDRIGTVNGVGDGSTTFNLPEFRARIMSFDPDGQVGNGRLTAARGAVAVVEAHPLTVAEIAGHVHDKGTLQADDGSH